MSLTKVSYSMIDGEVVNALDFGVSTESADNAAAFNACAAYCTTNNKAMFVPAGTYITSAWDFGTNTVGAQSDAPPILFGEGVETVIKAKSDETDTIINAKNTAGVIMRDFVVDCNSISGTGIDTSWHSVGPSLFNRYERIIVQNYTNAGWIATNNNDCSFEACMVRLPQGGASLAFSLKATGGLVYMKDCIWSDALLYLGAQNYVLTGCWGHGIQFTSGAVNSGVINGGYFYANEDTNAIFSTEAFTAGTLIESMVVNGTWLDLADGTKSIFNVRAAGKLMLNGCTVAPITSTPQLLSNACVADTGKVIVNFEGGRIDNTGGTLGTTYPSNFVVVKNNLNNQGVVQNNTSGSLTPQLYFGAGNTGMTTSNAVCRYSVRDGFCFFELLIALTNKGSSTGNAVLFTLPFTSNATAPDSVVNVAFSNVTYSGQPVAIVGAGATGVSLYSQTSGSGLAALTDTAFANNSEIRITGMYAL